MHVLELFDPTPHGYQTEKDDQSVMAKKDSRKNRERLTLGHLNQLRQSYDVRKLEHEKKLEAVSKQYAPAPAAGAGPMGI